MPAAEPGLWGRATSVLSQTVLISAVLYYFGWVRTQATWAFFGIDPALLGYSPADYTLRSINSAFVPLIGGGIAGLGAVALHRAVLAPAARSARLRRVVDAGIVAAYVTGALLVVLVALGLLFPATVGSPLGVLLPLALLAAASLLGYARHLRANRERPTRRTPPKNASLATLMLVLLGILGLLWSVALYARQNGTDFAIAVAQDLKTRPAVVLYSAERLAVAGPGVEVHPAGQDGAKYKYRYTGLVSLLPNENRYLLVAAAWHRGRDAVYVVPAGDDVRIDVIAP